MKFSLALLVSLIIFSPSVRAQDYPAQSMTQGTWDLGVFGGAGSGLLAAKQTHYAIAGFHVGRIMTREHLSGFARGNFEFAGDYMPLWEVFQPGPGHAVYGGNFTPIILQWNFTSNKRFAPFMSLTGGGLVTRSNVPPGNTSTFNFVAGGSLGFRVFVHRRRAINLETRWIHISNANLGTDNPQLVSNFAFTAGYNWYK
jgi:lipid A 3-O-deacylase